MNDKIYYVYEHIDPITKERVYIGHGCRERAWTCRPGRGKKYGGGHRKPEHSAWCDDLMLQGATPNDWVVILNQGLFKSEAKTLESNLLNDFRPVFNYQLGDNFKLTEDQYQLAIKMRRDRCTYDVIAKHIGVSAMTIWRRLNG